MLYGICSFANIYSIQYSSFLFLSNRKSMQSTLLFAIENSPFSTEYYTVSLKSLQQIFFCGNFYSCFKSWKWIKMKDDLLSIIKVPEPEMNFRVHTNERLKMVTCGEGWILDRKVYFSKVNGLLFISAILMTYGLDDLWIQNESRRRSRTKFSMFL